MDEEYIKSLHKCVALCDLIERRGFFKNSPKEYTEKLNELRKDCKRRLAELNG